MPVGASMCAGFTTWLAMALARTVLITLRAQAGKKRIRTYPQPSRPSRARCDSRTHLINTRPAVRDESAESIRPWKRRENAIGSACRVGPSSSFPIYEMASSLLGGRTHIHAVSKQPKTPECKQVTQHALEAHRDFAH
jgi:hypothetical protein